MRAYQQSEKGRGVQARYYISEKGRATRATYEVSERGKARSARHRLTEGGRATKARYNASEKCRTTLAMYAASEEGRVTAAKYRATANGKMIGRHAEARRRARKMGADSNHTYLEFTLLCEDNEFRCLACGKPFPLEKLTEDHIVPLSQEGGDNISNIQPLCKSCNCQKGIKATDYRAVAAMEVI